MKLDSEQQRSELIELLQNVPVNIPLKDLEQGPGIVQRVLDPIRNAEIEELPKTFTRLEDNNDG